LAPELLLRARGLGASEGSGVASAQDE